MIYERCDSEAVNNFLATVEPEQIRVREVVVKIVGLFVGEGSLRHGVLIFDDARGTEQVLPLLPVSYDCCIIITSRYGSFSTTRVLCVMSRALLVGNLRHRL